MIVLKNNFRNLNKKNISIFILLIMSMFLCFDNLKKYNRHHEGESYSYMMGTYAFENHFSDKIFKSDIENAEKEIPNFQWKGFGRKDGTYLPFKKGDYYLGFYAPTYSIFVIPFKKIVGLFHGNFDISWPFSNFIFLLLASFLSWKWLKDITNFAVFIPILLMSSPSILYIRWASAEIFIESCIVIGLSALFSNRFKTSVFFFSMAGSMNQSIMVFLPFIYINFFDLNFNESLKSNINKIKSKIIYFKKHTLLFVVFSLLGFYHIIVNLYRFGKVASMSSMGTFDNLFSRMFAYIFDLNFGLMPYFPLILFLFLIYLFISHKNQMIIYFSFMLFVLFGFSLIGHINCGMAGIHRYNSWFFVFFVIGSTFYLRDIKYISFINFLFICSIVIAQLHTLFNVPYYIRMQPVARLVLNYFPSFYNPLPSTFNSRTNHYDGGYDYLNKAPIVYTNKKGYVRKIWAKKSQEGLLRSLLYVEKDKMAFDHQLSKLEKTSKEGIYLNFASSTKIYKLDVIPNKVKLNQENKFNEMKNLGEGFSHPEPWGVWTDGKQAKLNLNFDKDIKNDVIIEIIGHPFLNKKNKQKITVYVDGKQVAHWKFKDDGSNQRFVFKIAKKHIKQNLVQLKFKIKYPTTPVSKNINSDGRALGFGLVSIKVSEKK